MGNSTRKPSFYLRRHSDMIYANNQYRGSPSGLYIIQISIRPCKLTLISGRSSHTIYALNVFRTYSDNTKWAISRVIEQKQPCDNHYKSGCIAWCPLLDIRRCKLRWTVPSQTKVEWQMAVTFIFKRRSNNISFFLSARQTPNSSAQDSMLYCVVHVRILVYLLLR